MSSAPWAKKTDRKPRRSEMRLGTRYEKAVAHERLPVRSVGRARRSVAPRVASLLLAMGLLAALAYVFLSDAYYVYDATVRGAALVSPEEIFERAEIEGYSVFFIDPAEAEERITTLPDVKEATVLISLPNRMVIEVQERQARVIWQTGESRYGVDDEGLIVSLRGDVEPQILIRDLDSTPRELGEQVNMGAVSAAESYHSLLPEVSEFEYSQERGLSYRNEYGWRVYLGDDTAAQLKMAVVDALVQRLTSQAEIVEFIDVRFPESPLYRLAEGSEEAS